MKRKKRRGLLLAVLLLSIVTSNRATQASHTTESGGADYAGYTVKARLPENQLDPAVSYFYLQTEPGSRQLLQVEINNRSAWDQTYEVVVCSAGTNRNGLLTYEVENPQVTAPDIQELVQVKEPELTLASGGSGVAELELQLPTESLAGIVLGGISIRLKDQESDDEGSGMTIENTYGYTIGILLKEESSYPDQDLGAVELGAVTPLVDNGQKIVVASVNNPLPQVFGECQISGKIISEKNQQVIAEGQMKHVRIAPYASFPFHIDWGIQDVKSGSYRFEAVVTGENDENKVWQFNQAFEILPATAQKMNRETVNKIVIPQWYCWTAIGLAGLTVLANGYLIFRRVRHQRARKKRIEGGR